VFDTLIQNGANDAAAVNFQIRDILKYTNLARAEAARKALSGAQVYAKALGAELGPVKLVREGGPGIDSITAYDIGALPDKNISEALQRIPGVALQSRIEASEQTITKSVTITWALK
jgi:uncharacterized protein YggE